MLSLSVLQPLAANNQEEGWRAWDNMYIVLFVQQLLITLINLIN